ncbi:OLC1v1036820C1 [Oldenlandia corymbosa var. corymbosa]|uniref:OLC1v1036820C1 n=1 Tax=Oldenlandia corymbosa var. corymbosa TaxID=529605 RepID=A0AAV1CYX4_OLDCO|nr:OLC1v1036820C1 [Oldenlandia corymbosa var. corymbosa]
MAHSASSRSKIIENKPPSESAAIIADSEHLLTQMLIKLPPKPLLRFQCISKSWLSIISDPAFRRRWATVRRNSGDVSVFFFSSRVKDIGVIFSLGSEGGVSPGVFNLNPLKDFMNDELDVSVHGCNGLWCIQRGKEFDRISIVVCNPTTWQHREIPIPRGTRWPKLRYSNIAFDPQNSDHYKLVCWGIDQMDFRFMVYSSESAEWRVIKDHIGHTTWVDYNFENGIFWNGHLHFIGHVRLVGMSHICLDVENEKIISNLTPIPDSCKPIFYFGEAGKDLCIVSLHNAELGTKFDVFALKRDHSMWAFKYRFDVAPLIATYPEIGTFEFFISSFIVRGEKAMIMISLAGKLISFDISNMMVDELIGFEGRLEDYRWKNVFQHVESLALV